MSEAGWRVAVDRGGTFTDVVATDPDGLVHSAKVLAEGTGEIAAIRSILGRDGLTALRSLRIGTTVATNALLTGAGAKTVLVVTEGFADLLTIGHQARPDIFALDISRLPPLAEVVIEARERVSALGLVRLSLDEDHLRESLVSARQAGVEAVAIAFAHAVSSPDHERRAAALATALGFTSVVASHELSTTIGLVDRARAAVADARLTPVLAAYVSSVSARVPPPVIVRFITSTGGLVPESRFRGTEALLSGPAGGVVACQRLARELGLPAVLGFDMGGTSTDVCRWAGELERRESTELAGRTIAVPALDVVSVASGGGSVLTIVDGRARVGPASAGADPGPACYGRGGPAAITDANLILGRLQPALFPRVFGPSGAEPLDVSASRRSLAGVAPGSDGAVEAAAAGFVAVANEQMAEAIAALSTARGHDPRDHALIVLGGAAGQHACGVARRLGIDTVVVHLHAGVLSAWGIAGAPRVTRHSRAILEPWDPRTPSRHAALVADLLRRGRETLAAEGSEARYREDVRWELRYLGAETSLWSRDREDFEGRHQRLFGFHRPEAAVEVLAVEAEVRDEDPPSPPQPEPPPCPAPEPSSIASVAFPGPDGGLRWRKTPVHTRAQLPPGAALSGPALVIDEATTVVLEPGWALRVGPGGALVLTDRGGPDGGAAAQGPDPVGLELYHRRFMGIATRMGETLRRVAWSTNVKERLDFSSALFDAEGQLVANAPHIPVHLGAMGETVRSLVAALPNGALRPGRSWAVNDPQQGGSHLPDITVITPVFDALGHLLAFAACRAHHADVGGITPGSMPPFSTRLEEEGVLLRALLLVGEGRWRQECVRKALASGPWPARDPDTVIADLQGQVAANTVGVDALSALALRRGPEAVRRWMGWVLDNGDDVMQTWLADFGPQRRTFVDSLDDGTPLAVTLWRERIRDRFALVVDFDGTGPASSANLNAPPAVSRAALLYVLRCVFARSIPLNEGVLRAVDLRLPAGSLLDPPPGAAVVGGNVETSQRIVDVLLGALGAAAASQGTMNNLTFGGADWGYYETICGGSGATPRGPGVDGVHTHMTNTRLTDPEVLERRHPVLVRRFALRPGSGGAGARRGGHGVVREIEFLAPADVALLSQRRTTRPFGLDGGGAGASGRACLVAADGAARELGGCFVLRAAEGDRLILETPGGGGSGRSSGTDGTQTPRDP